MRLPIRAIADVVADANEGRDDSDRILLCVDGVHGFGNQDIDVADLGCDFLVSGCHKWMFGPRGTGFVWGHHSAWERVSPTIPTFSPGGIIAWIDGGVPTDVAPGLLHTPGGFHSFENRWALTQAVEFHDDIGRDRIAQRTESLATRLKQGLADIDPIRVITPLDPELSAGIVCFEVDGHAPPSVTEALMRTRRISASLTPYQTQYVRMGPSILNSEDEVDETLRVLRSIV